MVQMFWNPWCREYIHGTWVSDNIFTEPEPEPNACKKETYHQLSQYWHKVQRSETLSNVLFWCKIQEQSKKWTYIKCYASVCGISFTDHLPTEVSNWAIQAWEFTNDRSEIKLFAEKYLHKITTKKGKERKWMF